MILKGIATKASWVLVTLRSTIFILVVFGIDSFLENYVELFYAPATTDDEYLKLVHIWNTCASFSKWLIYLIPLLLTFTFFKKLMEFDIFDQFVLVTCLFFAVIDSYDWVRDSNFRPSWLDWEVFVPMIAIIISLKLYHTSQKQSLA